MSSTDVSTFSYLWTYYVLHISGADDIPNGNFWYLYLPSGVIKVHNLELSSSNSSCQNPFELSNLENIFAPAILTITSSSVSNLKYSGGLLYWGFQGPSRFLIFRLVYARYALHSPYCGLSYSFYQYRLFHSVKFCFHFVKHGEWDFSTCLDNRYCFVFQFYAYRSWQTTYPWK